MEKLDVDHSFANYRLTLSPQFITAAATTKGPKTQCKLEKSGIAFLVASFKPRQVVVSYSIRFTVLEKG